METRKEQLEGESQELRLAKEALSVDIARVRKEKEIEESRLNRQIEALEQKMAAENRDHEVFYSHPMWPFPCHVSRVYKTGQMLLFLLLLPGICMLNLRLLSMS